MVRTTERDSLSTMAKDDSNVLHITQVGIPTTREHAQADYGSFMLLGHSLWYTHHRDSTW